MEQAARGASATSGLPPRPTAATAAGASAAAAAATSNSSSSVRKTHMKRRERDFPDVEWGQALAHFAACVRLELHELNAEFVARDVVTFAAWKELWRRRRLSAAFHVEFWESTPTRTHQTKHSPFDDDARAAAALFGHVFALYGAYSAQLGDPKHKIDVDPRAWAALAAIEGVATAGLGAVRFPKAARESLAMLTALEHRERAFLKCLRGFGHQFRTGDAAPAPEEAAAQPRSVDADPVVGLGPRDCATLLADDAVERLETLSQAYSDSLARLSGGNAAPRAATGGGSKRGRAAPAKAREAAQVLALSQEQEKSRAALLAQLRSFLAHKQGFDAADQLRQEIDAARLQKRRAAAAPARGAATAAAAAFARHAGANAPVAASEDEQLRPVAPSAAVHQRAARAVRACRAPCVASVASDDSGVTQLEAELRHALHDTTAAESRVRVSPRRPATAIAVTTRAARTRRQSTSLASVASDMTAASAAESDGLAELQAELNASRLAVAVKRKDADADADSDSVWDSGTSSYGDESESESDDGGLAELEAELEAEVRGMSGRPSSSTRTAATRQPATTVAAVGAREKKARATTAAKTLTRARAPGAAKPRDASATRRTSARPTDVAVSVATESDDDGVCALAALEADLALMLAAAAPAAPTAPSAANAEPVGRAAAAASSVGGGRGKGIARRQPRRSTRSVSSALSTATIESEDDALAELEAELSQGVYESKLPPAMAPAATALSSSSSTRTSATSPRERPAGIAPRAARTRRLRAPSVVSIDSDGGALHELQAELERASVVPSVPAVPVAPTAATSSAQATVRATPSRTRAMSVALSATESEGGELAALQAELALTAPAASASTAPGAARVTRQAAPSKRQLLARGIVAKRRKVSDAHLSVATESDGDLAALQAELTRLVDTAVPTASRGATQSSSTSGTGQALASRGRQPATRAQAASEPEVLDPAVGARKQRAVAPGKPSSGNRAASGSKTPRVPAKKPPASTRAAARPSRPARPSAPLTQAASAAAGSRVTADSDDDDDESDDELAELEAELQASTRPRVARSGLGKAAQALERTEDGESDSGGWWRVLLLRGLVQGDLA
ncbi:hypothetical protein PybrP1_010300, partial [[Pythium] brassicae (nom. inval.)]